MPWARSPTARRKICSSFKEFNRHQDYSEATALKIDAEIKRIVTDQYHRALKQLTDQGQILVRVAEALLEHEVLDGGQLLESLTVEAREPRKQVSWSKLPREAKVD